MKYTADNLVIESLDEYFDRLIKLYPDEKEKWEIRRKESKEFEEWSKEHPAPEGQVNCFPGWSV